MTFEQQDHHLLIAGCGYVGRALVRQCLAGANTLHHSITGTAGSTESIAKLNALGIRAQQLNLDGDGTVALPEAPWRLLYMIPPGRDADTDVRLSRLLAQLDGNQPQRIVYLSTSGVYGDRDGALTDESAPVRPGTSRARRRMDAETQVMEFAITHDLDWAILRVPGIYGPGRLRLDSIRDGRPVLRESECGPGNRIHRNDLAHCCQQALITPNARRIYNVCDDEHASSTAFTLEVAGQAGLEPPPQISLAEARRRFSEMRLSFLEESRQLDNRRMHEELGVTLRFPKMAAGIANSLATAPFQP